MPLYKCIYIERKLFIIILITGFHTYNIPIPHSPQVFVFLPFLPFSSLLSLHLPSSPAPSHPFPPYPAPSHPACPILSHPFPSLLTAPSHLFPDPCYPWKSCVCCRPVLSFFYLWSLVIHLTYLYPTYEENHFIYVFLLI